MGENVNEIDGWGKFSAGVLLIAATLCVVCCIIAYWPDKMPPITEGDKGALYRNECFHVMLIEKNDSTPVPDSSTANFNKKLADSFKTVGDELNISLKAALAKKTKNDSTTAKQLQDSIKNNTSKLSSLVKNPTTGIKNDNYSRADDDTIHLNTILLILVALMGFLGNMVHVATSFTTFVGNETFKSSWLLWYFVKPFTAAGLAVIIYFVIRGGFLSYGTGAAGINLYGLMALSALAGLFTDSATLKLKEVFEVIFKPKDDRKDKLSGDEYTVSPLSIAATGISTLTVTGKQLDDTGIKITIDKVAVTPVSKTAEKLEIKYEPTNDAKKAGKAVLLITNRDNQELINKNITIK